MNRRMSMVALLGLVPAVAVVQTDPEISVCRCNVCRTQMPAGTMELPDDGGWMPSYFDLEGNEVDQPICPDCLDWFNTF